jgi:hypothetical protein
VATTTIETTRIDSPRRDEDPDARGSLPQERATGSGDGMRWTATDVLGLE